jgi:hypothetical protein
MNARLVSIRLIALASLFILPAAQAQVETPLAVRALDNPQGVGAMPQVRAQRPSYEIPSRVLLGVGGAVAGAMGGALFGANVVYRGGCACEDPGLEEAVVGAAIGSVLTSAIFASIPDFGSTCSPLERVGLGVGGSLVGALAGGVVGAAMGGAGVLFGYMAGAGVGGGLATASCR